MSGVTQAMSHRLKRFVKVKYKGWDELHNLYFIYLLYTL